MTFDLSPSYSALRTTLLVMVFSSKVTYNSQPHMHAYRAEPGAKAEYFTEHGHIM